MTELRKTKQHFFRQVKKHISKNRLDKAMNLLIQFGENEKLENEIQNKILLLSNQLENIKHREMAGLGVPVVERNSITKRLLDLVTYLQEYQNENNRFNINNFIQSYKNNKRQMGFYTIGTVSFIVIALLLGLNAILSILLALLAALVISKLGIDI